MSVRDLLTSIFYDILYESDIQRRPNTIGVTDVIWCLRKAYYNYVLNARPVPNSWMIRGRLYHEGVFRVLSRRQGDYGIIVVATDKEVTVPIDEEFRLEGHVDLILQYDDVDYVVELKFPRNGSLNPRVEPRYVQQANCYVGMLRANGYEVSDLFYVVSCHVHDNRETRRVDVFVHEFRYDPTLYNATLERAKVLVDCIRKEQLPPPAETEWECRHCVYYQLGLCRPNVGLFKGGEGGEAGSDRPDQGSERCDP